MARFSFEGWDLVELLNRNKQWFVDNKGTVKWAVAAVAGLVTSTNPVVQGLVAAASKLVLDAFDYWISQ